MTRKKTTEKISNNLRLCIYYFAHTVEHLQDVKLNKLLYISHLLHYVDNHKLLTKTKHYSNTYGPHIPVLRGILKEDVENELLYFKDARTSDDPTYSNPCKIIRSNEIVDSKLSPEILQTIKKVSEQWGPLTYPEVLDFSNRTAPFLSTKYREQIELEKYVNTNNLLNVLPLIERKQIHIFISDITSDIILKSSQSSFISINEITEIYIALAKGSPEETLDRNLLGFNIVEIQKLISEFKDKKLNSLNLASFAYQIINSMCFDTYSIKVAILSALLIFVKNKIKLHADSKTFDTLPINLDVNEIKQWFEKLTT